MSDSTIRTEADAVAELATTATERAQRIYPDPDGVYSTIAHRDETVHLRSLEVVLAAPRRERGNFEVHTAHSFVDLTQNRRAHLNDETIVHVDRPRGQFTAVLNSNTWRDHTITYVVQHSRQIKPWLKLSGELSSQTAFAEFLRDNAGIITSPDAADLIEVARTFSATSKAEFEAGVRLASGDVQFTYLEETAAKAGAKGTVKVPETFIITAPIYEGGSAFTVVAELRYRISREGLRLGYVLLQLGEVQDAAFTEITEQVTAGLPDVLHVEGAQPAAARPIDVN